MKQALQPLRFAIILTIGILIGIWYSPNKRWGGNKVSQIVQLIKSNYVDTIDTETIEKEAVNTLLHSLDPHSSYLTATEAKEANEPLEGSFEGIGIEFLLRNDTIIIVDIIDDGPSYNAGLQVGDRITQVDHKVLNGMGLKNQDVIKLLKGESGSTLNLVIFRYSGNKVLNYSITRGSVSIKSVDAYFMADKETGYIKISRFAANTFEEYQTAYRALKNKGMQNLIIDLRDNGGGYLNTAQKLADEFLDANKKILTTRGEHTGNENFLATSKGDFEKGKLIVLVNENSASASEILCGALQDNDRALIIGRRTFGKGLVQNSFTLKDGSALRLTISRYYTPSGRCIQRPYNHGYSEYEDDNKERYHNGELFFKDSIKVNLKQVFTTLGGRKVYGGGGVVPDVFVPLDTSNSSTLLTELLHKSVIRQLAYSYVEKYKTELNKYDSFLIFSETFEVDNTLWQELEGNATSLQIIWTVADFKRSKKEIERHLKASIAKLLYKSNGYFYVENSQDETFLKAITCMGSEKYFEKLTH